MNGEKVGSLGGTLTSCGVESQSGYENMPGTSQPRYETISESRVYDKLIGDGNKRNGVSKENEHNVPQKSTEKSFAQTMDELRMCVWYWGPVTWQEAEKVLKDKPNGSFILRDSTSDRYIFSLSCKTKNSVIHARIPQHGGKYCYGGPRSLLTSESILEFIQQTIQRSEDGLLKFFIHPKNGRDEAENIHLLFPLSRNSVMPSLKHLCRFEILRRIRPDQIDDLILPLMIKKYLKNPNYIAEVNS